MKRVIYRITDFSDLSFIKYESCIEAYDITGNKIKYDKNLYEAKAEVIRKLIEKNKKALCAFGSSRDGTISQNMPFVVDNDGNYSGKLFNLPKNDKKTILGIKGLCGIIRGTIKYPDDNGEEIDITLEIRSRFDDPGKPWFLYTMIAESVEDTDAGEHIGNASFDETNDVDIMSMLTVLMFSMQLKKAYESGIYRTYVRREYNDDRLRGSIDIARHIRQNINSGSINVAYSTRERNENNMLNRLIAHAWNVLKRDYPIALAFVTDNDPDFQKAIGEITAITRDSLKDVRSCVAANRQPITSPFYSDYEELRELCLQILAEEAGSEYYTEGGENKCMSILFYIPDLWEIYLEKHLRKRLPESITIEAQNSLSTYFANGGYNQEIRPDYVFYHNKVPFFVLDAKFKIYSVQTVKSEPEDIPWELKPANEYNNAGEPSDDYNKVLRDMVSFGTHNAAIVFPYMPDKVEDFERLRSTISRNNINSFVHSISGYNKTDRFWHFPVLIPSSVRKVNSENYLYSGWKTDMTNSLDKSIDVIVAAITPTQ